MKKDQRYFLKSCQEYGHGDAERRWRGRNPSQRSLARKMDSALGPCRVQKKKKSKKGRKLSEPEAHRSRQEVPAVSKGRGKLSGKKPKRPEKRTIGEGHSQKERQIPHQTADDDHSAKGQGEKVEHGKNRRERGEGLHFEVELSGREKRFKKELYEGERHYLIRSWNERRRYQSVKKGGRMTSREKVGGETKQKKNTRQKEHPPPTPLPPKKRKKHPGAPTNAAPHNHTKTQATAPLPGITWSKKIPAGTGRNI